MRRRRDGDSPCAGPGGSPGVSPKTREFPSRRRSPPALETACSVQPRKEGPSRPSRSAIKKQPVPAIYRGGLLLYFLLKLLEQR